MSKPTPLRRLEQLTLVVTERCNQRCSYCYVPVERGRTMSTAVARRATELLFENAARLGTVSISFFGGEPFLVPELLSEVATRALALKKIGQRVTFGTPTNATAFDPKGLELARQLRMELAISIDGDGDGEECQRRLAGGAPSEPRVREALSTLQKMGGVRLVARITVTPHNVGRLASAVRRVAEAGFQRIVFLPAYEARWDGSSVDLWRAQHEELCAWLLERRRAGLETPTLTTIEGTLARLGGAPRRHCGAGVSRIAAATDGTLYPCYRNVYDPNAQALRLGDLEHGIDESVRARFAALDPSRPRPEDGSCESCSANSGCTFFCPALGHWLAGDIGVVPAAACALMRGQVAAVARFADRLRDAGLRRRRQQRAAIAASALVAVSSAGVAGCLEPMPATGGLCPALDEVDAALADASSPGEGTDAGAADAQVARDAMVRDAEEPGLCPVFLGDAGPSGEDAGGPEPGLCPVFIPDAGEEDSGLSGGLCPGLC